MLQIASGKLFTGGIGWRNELRGILYSNLVLPRHTAIETVAGRLLPTSVLRHSNAIIYECTECMEGSGERPGLIFSHGVDPYLDDFAAVVSFALLVTCTPDADLTGRLTSGRSSLSVKIAPGKLIKRAFDCEVKCQESDTAHISAFVRALIGLPRKRFLGVMRAIRTYVTALHRVGDDVELAYTLFVASIESLAQSFDGHQGEWKDFDEAKRNAVDTALSGAADDVADRVRAALLTFEHASLRRRFRDFALANLDPAFFRAEALGQQHPVGRSELPDALYQAYALRSRYVHSLDELPKVLTLGGSFSETIRVERDTLLTFQGLARLARHVITNFVFRQPHLDAEPYNYSLERAGIVQVQMASQYWVGQTEGITAAEGRLRLEGFLEQLAPLLDGIPDAAKLTDLKPMLTVVEPMLSGMRTKERLPFLVIYFLFNWILPPEQRMPNLEGNLKRFNSDLQRPSTEGLLAHLVQRRMPDWPIPSHKLIHDEYFRKRDRKNGLRVARSLEMRLTLMLAERCRAAGEQEAARGLIAVAVDNQPGQTSLLTLESNFEPDQPIDWVDELFRRDATAPTADNGAG